MKRENNYFHRESTLVFDRDVNKWRGRWYGVELASEWRIQIDHVWTGVPHRAHVGFSITLTAPSGQVLRSFTTVGDLERLYNRKVRRAALGLDNRRGHTSAGLTIARAVWPDVFKRGFLKQHEWHNGLTFIAQDVGSPKNCDPFQI